MMCHKNLNKIIILILIIFLFISNIFAEDIEKENEEIFEKLFGTPKELKTKRDYREIFENPFNTLEKDYKEENSRIYAKIGWILAGRIGSLDLSVGAVLSKNFELGCDIFTLIIIPITGFGGHINFYLFDFEIIKPYVTCGMAYSIIDYNLSGTVGYYGTGIKLNMRKIIKNLFGQEPEVSKFILYILLQPIMCNLYFGVGYVHALDFDFKYLPAIYYHFGYVSNF